MRGRWVLTSRLGAALKSNESDEDELPFSHPQRELVDLVMRKILEDDDYGVFHNIIILSKRNDDLLEKLAQEFPRDSSLFYYPVLVAEGNISKLGPPCLLLYKETLDSVSAANSTKVH